MAPRLLGRSCACLFRGMRERLRDRTNGALPGMRPVSMGRLCCCRGLWQDVQQRKVAYVTGHCTTTKNKCRNTTKGKYVWSTGDFYKGQFDVNGIMEGNGLIRWNQTKDVYEGTFKAGLPHGVGLYWWGKGTQRYLGHFKNGRKSGQGVYRNVENGNEVYAGEFQDGVFSGRIA